MKTAEPRAIYSRGEREKILRQYLDRGWQLVKLRGYHRDCNPDRAYNKSKIPVEVKWNTLRPSLQVALDWMDQDGWIGLCVPPGYVACDIDDPEAVSWLEDAADPSWTISRTKNGYHVLFRVGEVGGKIAGTTKTTRAGIKVTYRTAGKNQLVVAPSPLREWVQWDPGNAPVIPDALLPVPQETPGDALGRVIDLIKKLFDAPPGEKHTGRIRGSRLLGGIIAGGSIAEGDPIVEELIRYGVTRSDDPSAAESTIRSGIENGKTAPIRDLGSYAAGVRRPEGMDVIEGPHKTRAAVDVAFDVVYFLMAREWFRTGAILYYRKKGHGLTPVQSARDPEWRGILSGIRWWTETHGMSRSISPGVLEAAWMAASVLLPTRKYIGGPGVVGDRVVVASDGDCYVSGGPWEVAKCTAAESAAWLMDEVFCDFAWGGTSDFLRAMAELLTGFLPGAFDGPIPMFLHHASTPGAGKTLLAEVIGAIIDSEPSRFSGDSDDVERGKRIYGLLSRRCKYAYIDNQKNKFGGQMWESLCTSRDFEERIMHTQKITRVPNNCVWAVTGNNVPISPDMARRLVIIDVDARGVWRDPALFRHVPLLAWVRKNRRAIVGHVLRILTGWVEAGCPKGRELPQSYEEWGGVISGVLQYAWQGCPVLIDRDGASLGHDEHTQAWIQIVHEWSDSSIGDIPSPVSVITERLQHAPWGEITPIHRYSALSVAIGAALSRSHGRVYDGIRIDRKWAERQHKYLYSVAPCGK